MKGYETYSDDDFTAGDSPFVIDLETDIGSGENAVMFFNDGPGDLILSTSGDSGATFGSELKLKGGEQASVGGTSQNQLKIAHSGVDSSFRMLASASDNMIGISNSTAPSSTDETTQMPVLLNSAASEIVSTAKFRQVFEFYNDSNQLVWLKLQAASVDNLKEGIPVDKGGDWKMPISNPYFGEISAIAEANGPTINFTEY